jgi:LuxR family maltose regulon positive regulatory protein
VIATRHDPPLALPRLRVRGELVELRLSDLRFTPEEMGAVLNQQRSLGLSTADLAALHGRIEGWAAGLTLVASSLEPLTSERERRQFLARLAHTERQLFDYLADEVLNRQDPFVRMFLLETAVLPELTPAACMAVTGRADAISILDELYRRNLFLVALDQGDGPATYRYHDLFRAFLQARLLRDVPEWNRELHRRAAEAALNTAYRIFHYQQAELWEQAAQTIAEAAPAYLARGAFETVRQWVVRLPEVVRSAHPRLELWLGMCLWQQFDFDGAQASLTRALAGFDATGDPAGQAEALVWLSLGANLWSDERTAQATIGRALGAPLQAHQRIRVLVAHALGLTLHERWQEANVALDEALDLAETTGDPQVIAALAADLQAPFSLLPGGVARYERALRTLWRAGAGDSSAALVSQYVLRATISMWRGAWDRGIAEMRAAYAFLETTGAASWQILNLGGYLLVTTIIRSGAAEDDPALELLLSRDDAQGDAFTRSVAISFQFHYARGQWLLGNLEEVRRVYDRIVARTEGSPFQYVRIMRLLLAGYLALSDGRLGEAERVWQAAAELQDQTRFTLVYSDAHLLLAALALQMDRAAEALRRLGLRLEEYAAEQLPGVVMWHGRVLAPVLQLALAKGVQAAFAAQVLDGLGAPGEGSQATAAGPEPRVPETGEVLTPREVEVLRLLAEGASNPEIADALVISVHTVKAHVASILAKLGASSRTAAARRGAKLGLL